MKIWDSNLGGTEYPVTFSGADPSETRSAAPAQQDDVPQAVQQSHGPGGYQCSSGNSTWVQTAPCPHTMEIPHTTTIRHSDGTWTTVDSDRPTHVHQQRLSHDALCNSLHGDAGVSSYDKNRMQSDANCH